jgi:hypothetical protein
MADRGNPVEMFVEIQGAMQKARAVLSQLEDGITRALDTADSTKRGPAVYELQRARGRLGACLTDMGRAWEQYRRIEHRLRLTKRGDFQ